MRRFCWRGSGACFSSASCSAESLVSLPASSGRSLSGQDSTSCCNHACTGSIITVYLITCQCYPVLAMHDMLIGDVHYSCLLNDSMQSDHDGVELCNRVRQKLLVCPVMRVALGEALCQAVQEHAQGMVSRVEALMPIE